MAVRRRRRRPARPARRTPCGWARPALPARCSWAGPAPAPALAHAGRMTRRSDAGPLRHGATERVPGPSGVLCRTARRMGAPLDAGHLDVLQTARLRPDPRGARGARRPSRAPAPARCWTRGRCLSCRPSHEPCGRNAALNHAAGTLGCWIAAGALDQAEVGDALYAAALAHGLVADDGQRQCWATIRRGLGAGLQEPADLDRNG